MSASLAKFTKRRSFDHGVGMDLVCLPPPPLHSVPVFEVRRGRTSTRHEFRFPHWLLVYFYEEGSSKTSTMLNECDDTIQSESDHTRTSADIHHASVIDKSSQYIPPLSICSSVLRTVGSSDWPRIPCPSEAVELDVTYDKFRSESPNQSFMWMDKWYLQFWMTGI